MAQHGYLMPLHTSLHHVILHEDFIKQKNMLFICMYKYNINNITVIVLNMGTTMHRSAH